MPKLKVIAKNVRQAGIYIYIYIICSESQRTGAYKTERVLNLVNIRSIVTLGGHLHRMCLQNASASGAVPSEDRGTCEQCPPMHYSVGGLDTCFACDLPLLLVDNHCVSWQSRRHSARRLPAFAVYRCFFHQDGFKEWLLLGMDL